MLYNIWLAMVIIGLILLVVSLILVFALKIPELMDELSGRKAKRQIKRLKELNIGTGGLDGMVTGDFYLSMPSSTLLDSESINIASENIESKITEKYVPNTNFEEESTSFIDESKESLIGEEVSTNYLDSDTLNDNSDLCIGNIMSDEDKGTCLLEDTNIVVIEEHSSIF